MPLARFCRRMCSCCQCVEWDKEKKDETDTLWFDDKERKIDYVLVYKADDENDDAAKEKQRIRDLYQANLKKNGAHIEVEPKEKSQDQKTCFVKLHIPWHILLKYAERMKLKMPLKDQQDENAEEPPDDEKICCCDCSWYGRLKQKLLDPFKLDNEIINEKFGNGKCFTAEFTHDKINYFDIKDKHTFFSNPERSRIAYRIMDETRWGDDRKNVGINRLELDGVYCAAYPLHDGEVDKHSTHMDNLRQLLYREWARWGRWYKFQPLDVIRYYLGDKVGIYFAWLGFYTRMLIFPSFVGVIGMIYGFVTLSTYAPITEICDPNDPNYAGNLTMCPLCDATCNYWKLKTVCSSIKITHLFDNEATIFFAIFMSLWATFFLEFWKRRQFRLAYDWDLVDFDEEKGLVRPEYEALVDREVYNPATGQKETAMAPRDKLQRVAASAATVAFWVGLIIVAVFSIIVYRVAMHAVFAASVHPEDLGALGEVASPTMLTTITGSIISITVILLLNKVYGKVAVWLTNKEIPRTRIAYEKSYTMKIFCFQFVNFYSYLFYIAFFKNNFTGHPGRYNYLFGEFRWEGCEAGGCMYELTIQLLIIMVAKQALNNFLELVIPWATNKYRKYKSEKVEEEDPTNTYTRWEMDYDLIPIGLNLFEDYLEMVIQFGFITLFVAAFPLAPLLALINNIIEIRLDALKFITQFRRPLALKASDIGAWYNILEFIGILAVATNSFTIAVTAEAIPKLAYYYFYSPAIFQENTLVGFINDSLSIFDVNDFRPESIPTLPPPFPGETITECRYKSYRSPPNASPPYELTLKYWHILAARLAFVIVMEHVVFFLKAVFNYAIPDRPKKLMAQIKREHYLVENMLLQEEKEQILTKYSKDPNSKKHPDDHQTNTNGDHQPKTNASNGSGVVAYENEMKTTPM